VFVKPDMINRHVVLETEGVIRLVGINGRPSPIRDEEIDWLRRIVHRPSQLQREHYLDVGQRVRVTGGPLSGVEGIVKQLNSQTRVVISLASIVQSVSVQVDADLLQPIAANVRSVAL
jgi:transcription antitermination factor NusG